MAKTRTPAKKFTGRKFSERRLERAERYRREFGQITHANQLPFFLAAAEKILEARDIQNARLIFIGQAMRPLFDAVRTINEARQICPRRNLRYFVAPRQREERISKAVYDSIKERLAKKIVSPKQKLYYIVDMVWEGRIMRTLMQAIQEINPAAQIHRLDHPLDNFPTFTYAQSMPTPTVKDAIGKLSGKQDDHARDFYLFFQKYLQDYIDEVKKGRKPITPEEALERALAAMPKRRLKIA